MVKKRALEAFCPSPPPARPIPYGPVSLWDMINFNLHAFMWTLILIRQERALAERRATAAPGAKLSPTDQERLKGVVEHGIARVLNELFIADDRVQTIIGLVAYQGSYRDLAHEFEALDSDVLAATKYERFYHYPRDKGLMLMRVPGDWAASIKAFPSAAEDINAAVDCYALGHNNARVHHSMMVLEYGLPALATKLKVEFNPDKATWTDLTRAITAKISDERLALSNPPKGKPPPTRATAKKKGEFLEACEEAAIEFRYFTTVWQNHVAHGRGDYDENDAKKVLEHVRTFMEVIADKLKLKE